MSTGEVQGRKPRVDVQRNRAALLEAAQRHFLRYGVGTSLEAVAKEAGVGPGTLYRHFPNREALLAAVLQTRSQELVARQADIARLDDAAEALGDLKKRRGPPRRVEHKTEAASGQLVALLCWRSGRAARDGLQLGLARGNRSVYGDGNRSVFQWVRES
jgi:AcrR family transcriptional regulator